ncbi:hypothetical protein [Amycolatopsis sp. cmx-11-51]|uniref:hypothetical protein n=1 Tax=Amycolatopsis sp. cmx-11-51 TaxID=2785797 RepID=UPI0039E4DDBC
MINLLHTPAGYDDEAVFQRALRDARLESLRISRAHQDFFAESSWVSDGGRERATGHYRGLPAGAGFELNSVHGLPLDVALLRATRR